MNEKVIGVIGGLGPDATVDLFKKLLAVTPATIEQEHLRILIDNNPKTPCRIKAILGDGSSPGPVMANMAKNLENAGADLLLIACNTAHYYYPQIASAVKIPVLNIIEETVKKIRTDYPSVSKVGLMASSALLKVELYQKAFAETGIQVIEPTKEETQEVMDCVFRLKGGEKSERNRQGVLKVANSLIKRGAQAIVAGCTELPILLTQDDIEVPYIDPTEVLAQRAVFMAKGLE